MEQTPHELPKEDLISDYVSELRQSDMEQHERAIKKARNTLYLVSVLMFIGELVGMLVSEEGYSHIGLVIALLEAGIFVALAAWTRRKPYSAIVGGLIAFIGIHTLGFAINLYAGDMGGALKALLGGIIIKILVLVTLFQALKNAKAVQYPDKI